MATLATNSGTDAEQAVESVGDSDVLHSYAEVRDVLTHKQWQVVRLCYGRNLTQEEIAHELGTTRSAVSGLLTRARRRRDDHLMKRRARQFRAMRKELDE